MEELKCVKIDYLLTKEDVEKVEEVLALMRDYEKDGEKPFKNMSFGNCFGMIMTNGWRNELGSRIEYMRRVFEQ